MGSVVCVGDLFLECILPFPPESHPTTVVDAAQPTLGGNAYNICWNLAQLGVGCTLAAPFARRRKALIDDSLLGARDRRWIAWTPGDSDLLVAFVAPDRHFSAYLRGQLPRDACGRLFTRARRCRWAILAGSRHRPLRRMFAELVGRSSAPSVVFTPSYTIFEYAPKELEPLLRRPALVIMNESEARYAGSLFGAATPAALAKLVTGTLIVTYADRGAAAYCESQLLQIESVSNRRGDVVGAGDAFLAGYLHALWGGASPPYALRFASVAAAAVADAGRPRIRLSRREITRRIARFAWNAVDVARRPPE